MCNNWSLFSYICVSPPSQRSLNFMKSEQLTVNTKFTKLPGNFSFPVFCLRTAKHKMIALLETDFFLFMRLWVSPPSLRKQRFLSASAQWHFPKLWHFYPNGNYSEEAVSMQLQFSNPPCGFSGKLKLWKNRKKIPALLPNWTQTHGERGGAPRLLLIGCHRLSGLCHRRCSPLGLQAVYWCVLYLPSEDRRQQTSSSNPPQIPQSLLDRNNGAASREPAGPPAACRPL